MESILDNLKNLLQKDERLVSEGELLKNKVIELAIKLDKDMIESLLSDEQMKAVFFKQIGKATIFDKDKFIKFVSNKQFLPDSYTTFKNKIGLVDEKGEFISEKKEVVLSWPYKDCILEGGMTKEEQKRDEIFWNEILAPDEISRLLDPKVFTNAKRIDKSGEHKFDKFKTDENGDIKDNLIIKGNNLLALHSIKKRFAGKVKLIYIDPPYNTGNDEFLYKDNYQHSSWLTMMGNRLNISEKIMLKNGAIFSSIDDNELVNYSELFKTIYYTNSIISTLIWKKADSPNEKGQAIATYHEYVLTVKPNPFNEVSLTQKIKPEIYSAYPKKTQEGKLYRLRQLRKNGKAARRSDRPNLFYPIIAPDGEKIYPIAPEGWEGRWVLKEETYNDLVLKNEIEWVKRDYGWMAYYYEFAPEDPRVPFPSIIDDVDQNRQGKAEYTSIMGSENFETPKPSNFISRLLQIGTIPNNTDIICDFFAGSGTTAHAALKLNREDKGNRKYLLVEMAGYFDTVMKPRIQKVVYSSEWKDGKPQNTDGISHIFKYLVLEQYEDTLNNIEFKKAGTVQKTLMDMEGYLLRYMLDFETRESPCRMNVAKLERPFEYTLRITRDNQLHNETVDLVETFNYLLGLKVKRIRTFKENGTTYRIVHGETLTGQSTTVIWRTTVGLDLKKDKKFTEETLLKDPKLKAERIYLNGDFHVEGALPIEPEFQRLMGA